MNTTAHPRRSLPMPLWLQGAVELFSVAVLFYATVVLLLTAVWYTNGFNDGSLTAAFSLAGHVWLLVHGVPLAMNLPEQGGFAAVAGTMSLMPLGLTLIPLALCFRSGRRLARASYEGQFWQPLAGGATAYALVGAGVSVLSAGDQFATSIVLAALIPLWGVVLGVLAGGYAESRSLASMIGVNAADWVKQFSQYSRWAGSYLWTLVRASLISVLAFVAGGALLFTAAIFWHWADILTLYQTLHAGAVGGAVLTLLQLGLIPNLVIYAMAWASGAGFALGTETTVSPVATDVGVLPALPLLGALPHAHAPWGYIAFAVPLLAGAVGGWWFFREGENHLDEWMSLKIRFRWISWPLSTLGMALASLLPTFLTVLALGWLSNGSLGIGRFTAIGPNPLIFAGLSALWLAVGMMLGLAAAHLLVKDTSVELERFATGPRPTSRAKRRALGKRRRRALAVAPALPADGAEETADGESAEADADAEPSAPQLALTRILGDENSQQNGTGTAETDAADTTDAQEDTEEKAPEPAETALTETDEPATTTDAGPAAEAEQAADADEDAPAEPEVLEPAGDDAKPAAVFRPVVKRPKARKSRRRS